tara:strand:- start:858 stop:1088 length:231 start_codon:yes stop_codon:yes gene_type:complete
MNSNTAPYFYLVGFDKHNQRWDGIFGDYSHDVVKSEQRDGGHQSDYKYMRIIKLESGTAEALNDALDALHQDTQAN